MSTTEQSIYNEVFISYSRKNIKFARKLVEAIYANGRENVWIDWEDIEYAEDWWDKIQRGIDSAENFVFILSPASVQSHVCYDEVDYAVQAGKRIIPLVYEEITAPEDFEKMHPAISQHNWLPFTDENDFEEGMSKLFTTLDTDLAHVRFHTRLQTRAREWELAKRTQAYLLTAGEIEEAQEWLASFAAEEKIPLATDLQRDYVDASKVAEDERRERERILEERARRNRLYLFAAIPSIIGLIITSIFAVVAYRQSIRATEQARLASEQRQVAESEAEIVSSVGLATFASFWGRDGEEPLLGLSYALAANAPEQFTNGQRPPVEAQFTLAELAWQPGARRQLVGHLGEIWGVDYTPDGHYVFSGAGSFTGLPDNRMIQWDVNTGEIVREFDEHVDRIYAVDVSPDGRYIATGSQDTNVIIWDFETGEVKHLLGEGTSEHGVPIFNVMFTNDSSKLISGGRDRIIVWDVETGAIVNRFEGIHGDDHILDMDITNDDTMVFSGGFDGSVRYWELATGDVALSMEAGQVTGARIFPNEEQAITSDQGGNLIIWNLTTGQRIRTITNDEQIAFRGGVVITSDGELIVAADDNGNLRVWEADGNRNAPIFTLRGHDERTTALAINPNGTEVVTASFDRSLIIWDILGRDAEKQRFEGNDASVYSAVLSPDERLVAGGFEDGRILIWDTTIGQLRAEIQASDQIVYDLVFSPDGSQLASTTEDGTVQIWDIESRQLVVEYTELIAPARAIAYSPDGSLLAAAGGQVQISENRPIDNRIIIWNQDGDIVHRLDGHDAAVRDLAFTPDGTGLVSASDDTLIILWDVQSGESIRTYSAHTDAVWSISFNSDGTQFLSGSRDTTVMLWNIEETEPLNRLEQHSTGVRVVAFHPDNIHAITGAGSIDTSSSVGDFDLLYWDLTFDEPQVLREMPGHNGTVRSLMFTANGNEILSAADDGLVILWYADTLRSLIDRVISKYQTVCLPEIPDCSSQVENIVVADDSDNIDTTTTGFPTQSPDTILYAEDSLCRLPNNGTSPVNNAVDASIFASEPPYIIGYSYGGIDGTSDEWVASWATYEAQQSDLIENFIVRSANGNVPQQVNDLQILLDAGADAIIINPIELSISNSADLQDKIKEIVDSGIPVILVGNRTFSTDYTTYVGHDPFELGCVMMQELVAFLDGEGSMAVINGSDLSTTDIAFKDGVEAVIGEYGGILLTIEGATNYSRDTARALTSLQEVVGMVGYVSEITLGGQEGLALQSLPYVPFSSDHGIELAQFALTNNVEGAFVRSTTQMGAVAVQTALAILQGEDTSQFIRIAPTVIRTDEITLDELAFAPINGYLGDWEELPVELYPAIEADDD